MKKLLAVFACVLVLGVSQASANAPFCHDNTDKLIVQLKKVDLTTEQLKDVFVFQKQHREFVAQSHTDGRGCSAHERMEVTFERQSIGVLTDEQFKKYKGRVRNENEGLRYENYLLKKEVQRMKKEMEALKAEMKAAAAGN
jgi:hypothetical protein